MIFDFFETLADFLAMGGWVLKIIVFTVVILWILIIERILFFKSRCSWLIEEAEKKWKAREDKKSWFAKKIRQGEIAKLNSELIQNIPLIKTIVAICPLLGLLGTVTGMIAVFDVMALTGTGNARQMAEGISMATIPTLAGMVTALSGLYFVNLFQGKVRGVSSLIEGQIKLEF